VTPHTSVHISITEEPSTTTIMVEGMDEAVGLSGILVSVANCVISHRRRPQSWSVYSLVLLFSSIELKVQVGIS